MLTLKTWEKNEEQQPCWRTETRTFAKTIHKPIVASRLWQKLQTSIRKKFFLATKNNPQLWKRVSLKPSEPYGHEVSFCVIFKETNNVHWRLTYKELHFSWASVTLTYSKYITFNMAVWGHFHEFWTTFLLVANLAVNWLDCANPYGCIISKTSFQSIWFSIHVVHCKESPFVTAL